MNVSYKDGMEIYFYSNSAFAWFNLLPLSSLLTKLPFRSLINVEYLLRGMHELADDTPLKYNGKDGFSQMHKMWAIGPRNKTNVQDKKIHNPCSDKLLLQCLEYRVYSVQLPTLLKLHSRCSSGTR